MLASCMKYSCQRFSSILNIFLKNLIFNYTWTWVCICAHMWGPRSQKRDLLDLGGYELESSARALCTTDRWASSLPPEWAFRAECTGFNPGCQYKILLSCKLFATGTKTRPEETAPWCQHWEFLGSKNLWFSFSLNCYFLYFCIMVQIQQYKYRYLTSTRLITESKEG